MNPSRTQGPGNPDFSPNGALKLNGINKLPPEEFAVWCRAFFEGGNTLRLWNESVPLKILLLAASYLQKDQRVVLIGKYAGESGLTGALRSLLSESHLDVVDIDKSLNEAWASVRLQWDFLYLNSVPEKSVDRIILFNAASHVRNWEDFGRQIIRVLNDRGRLVIAEAPYGGPDFLTAFHLDSHLEAFITKVIEGTNLKEEGIPDIGIEFLNKIFGPLLSWNKSYVSNGLYVYYGQKSDGKEEEFASFAPEAGVVQDFLTEKPRMTPWDFLSESEIKVIGDEFKNISRDRSKDRYISLGILNWMYEKSAHIRGLMYEHLKAKKGDKVLLIGEQLEMNGFLPEIRKRIGEEGAVIAIDMTKFSGAAWNKRWQSGGTLYDKNLMKWEYDYADEYPDNYFDILCFPQGVHHAPNWMETASRLLKKLKPSGQVIMMEARLGGPEYHIAVKLSGLARCIGEKVFWGMCTTVDELPDVSTAELRKAFNQYLTNIFSLEWKGWLLFWGDKR